MTKLCIYLSLFILFVSCKNSEEVNEELMPIVNETQKDKNIKIISYQNGSIKYKQTYNNLSELHGEWIHYRANGNIIQIGNYENNIPSGKWITYNEDGTIKKEDIIIIDTDCVDMVALWSAEDISKKIGKDKKWVFFNYTFPLWDKPSNNNATKIGELRVMSYSEILDRSDDFYYVLSTNKKQKGWVNKADVKTISRKNRKTNALCE